MTIRQKAARAWKRITWSRRWMRLYERSCAKHGLPVNSFEIIPLTLATPGGRFWRARRRVERLGNLSAKRKAARKEPQ